MSKPEALRLVDELDADRNWLAARGLHQQSMAEASAELRRLHADAERYRYLRNRSYLRNHNPQEILPVIGPAAGAWIDWDDENEELTLLTGEDADAAIDAAMGKK